MKKYILSIVAIVVMVVVFCPSAVAATDTNLPVIIGEGYIAVYEPGPRFKAVGWHTSGDRLIVRELRGFYDPTTTEIMSLSLSKNGFTVLFKSRWNGRTNIRCGVIDLTNPEYLGLLKGHCDLQPDKKISGVDVQLRVITLEEVHFKK